MKYLHRKEALFVVYIAHQEQHFNRDSGKNRPKVKINIIPKSCASSSKESTMNISESGYINLIPGEMYISEHFLSKYLILTFITNVLIFVIINL